MKLFNCHCLIFNKKGGEKMKKRLLSKIPIKGASEAVIQLSKSVAETEIKYICFAEEVDIEDKKILLLYFYPQSNLKDGKTKAEFRIFLTKDDYITQDLTVASVKWKISCISNLIGSWYSWTQDVGCDKQSQNAIKQYLNCGNEVLAEISSLQNKIMQVRLEAKHKKITDKIDNQMELVPELPNGWDEWINEKALVKSRYIYYEYKKNKKLMNGYCTYCKKDVAVEKPRHNKEGVCPNCLSEIIYKAQGKSLHVEDSIIAAIMQKVDAGFIVRKFFVKRIYGINYKKSYTLYCESTRDFYYDNETLKYEYAQFRQTGNRRWCNYEGIFSYNRVILYEHNIAELIKDSEYKYSAIEMFATHMPGFTFNIDGYLYKYKQHPIIEYFVKSKLYKLVEEIVDFSYDIGINLKGKNFEEILKVNKQNIPLLKELDADIDELKIVQTMEKQKINLSAETIKYISSTWGYATDLLELSEYTTVNKAIKYIQKQAQLKVIRHNMCCNFGTVPITVKEKEMYKLKNTYNDWIDYIRFCKELNYDLSNEFILYPKNLIEVHDKLDEEVRSKRNKEDQLKQQERDNKIKKMYIQLNKLYAMENKEYLIRPPIDADELKKEGQTLHHCVGNYINDIAKGETIVLLVREKKQPQIPFVTIEVKNNKIKQCRGKCNKEMTLELKPLLSKFKNTKLLNKAKKEAI